MAEVFLTPLCEMESHYNLHSIIHTPLRFPRHMVPRKIEWVVGVAERILDGMVIFFRLIQCGPKIVVAHNTTYATLPLIIGRMFGVGRLVYFNHGVAFVAYRGFVKKILVVLEVLNCFMADKVVTVSTDMRRILRGLCDNADVYLNYRGSVCGVPMNQALHWSDSLELKQAARVKYHIAEKEVVVLFVGRCRARKGIFEFFKLAQSFSQHSNVVFIVCGFVRNDAIRYGVEIPENCRLLGFVNNIHEVLLASNVLVVTSRHEGLGLAAAEAMALKVPVIAPRIPGLRCLYPRSVRKYMTYTPGDQTKLESIVSGIVKNVDVFRVEAESCYNFLEQNFGRDKVRANFGTLVAQVYGIT